MKDIMQKLAELEATAPKAKKMLTEDTISPIIEETKDRTLKNVFQELSETATQPFAILDPQNKQSGVGVLKSNNPAVDKVLQALNPKEVQVVQTTTQGQQPTQTTPAPAGATGQPVQGQQPMREKDEGKPGKNFAKIAKSAGERYGSKAAGERVAGAIRAKLAKQGKLEEGDVDGYYVMGQHTSVGWYPSKEEAEKAAKKLNMRGGQHYKIEPSHKPKMREEQLAELSPETIKAAQAKRHGQLAQLAQTGAARSGSTTSFNAKPSVQTINQFHDTETKAINRDFDQEQRTSAKYDPAERDAALASNERSRTRNMSRGNMLNLANKKLQGTANVPAKSVAEGAKVDRMVKHIEKSERKLGKSKDKAEDIAWATANKRGMLDNKNKKKVKEADIPSTQGIDTQGAGLGAGRSPTTLEGKTMSKKAKPDFLDMDKDGNKKESMKKAVADKKKKTVKEGMSHRIAAARFEGKSDGLRGGKNRFKDYEDLDEARAYHEGYKDGLDECYGQGVYENAPGTPPATVGGMADGAMEEGKLGKAALALGGAAALATGAGIGKNVYDYHHRDSSGYSQADVDKIMGTDSRRSAYDREQERRGTSRFEEDEMEEGNAFTGALAKTPKGGQFKVGGKTFTDRTGYDAKLGETDYAFESWDRELANLLNEGTEVNEGLSVSVSKGQQNSPDSVTITAQDAEADQLLQLVKHAGLGLFGDDHAEPSQAMSIQPTTGEPDEVGAGGADIEVVDGSDDMLSLMQKLGGISGSDDEDYADEEGHGDELHGDEGHDEDTNEANCNECGMMETECQCDKEQVEEVESEDQQEFEVAEDNAPDSDEAETSADEEAEAEEDKALATKSMNESFTDILARLNALSESKKEDDNEDENPEEDGPDHGKAWHDTSDELKENEEDEEDAIEESEDLTEWANQVGPGEGKGTDASFEEDIEFMTKVIAGGLNKPKSTGQTTIPVIAGQNERMHDHQGSISDTVDDWTKLAGIK